MTTTPSPEPDDQAGRLAALALVEAALRSDQQSINDLLPTDLADAQLTLTGAVWVAAGLAQTLEQLTGAPSQAALNGLRAAILVDPGPSQ